MRVDGYFDYLKDSAWTWEHMALTRARPISGLASLQERIRSEINQTLSRDRENSKLLTDVHQMRQRMADEHRGDSPWDVKHHRGGLVDIEFLAQYLQLKNRSGFSTTTATALEKLAAASQLSSSEAEDLLSALRLWQGLQSIIRLIGPERLEGNNPPAGQAEALCRVGNVESFEFLRERVEQQASAVQEIFNRLIDVPAANTAE